MFLKSPKVIYVAYIPFMLAKRDEQLKLFCILKFHKRYTIDSFKKALYLDPVVQSIFSSLRGQLVKCFTIFLAKHTDIFVEKMKEAFAMQKLLTFFLQNIIGIY